MRKSISTYYFNNQALGKFIYENWKNGEQLLDFAEEDVSVGDVIDAVSCYLLQKDVEKNPCSCIVQML
jgi:hypothetical protein